MRLTLATAAVTLLASTAFAQTPAAKPAATTTTSTTSSAKAVPKPRTAALLQCSKDADAKNIHGKPRKAFMEQCKKAAVKS